MKTDLKFIVLLLLFASCMTHKKEPKWNTENGLKPEQWKPKKTKTATTYSDPVLAKGMKLFKTNCATCHYLDNEKVLVGPGLKDVMKRVPDANWLKLWIQNNQKLILTGDEYANHIYEAFNRQQMNAFTHLSEKDLDALVNLLEKQ